MLQTGFPFNRLSSVLLLSLAAFSSWGNEAAPSKDIAGLSNWPIILFALFGMIGFIFALAWFVKRFGGMQFTGGSDMKIVSAMVLGPKERVILVDIKGKQLLLGVTSQQISRLHEFEQAVIPVAQSGKTVTNDFLSKFQSLLNAKSSQPAQEQADPKHSPEETRHAS